MNEKEYLSFLFNQQPEDIVNWYASKGYQFSWNWQDVWQDAHARAFTVAKAMKLDVLESIKKEVDRIFTEGITFDEFQKNLEPTLKRLGWWGKVKAKDVPGYVPSPDVDPEQIVELGSPRRLKTIFQTNANVAYNTARWKAFLGNVASRPLLRFNQIDRPTKRKSHSFFHRKTFYWNDPIWDYLAPPLDWNCGCYLTAHTLKEAEANGWTISKGSDFVEKAEEIVPPEWQYNPGKNYLNWDNSEDNFVPSDGKAYYKILKSIAKSIPDDQKIPLPELLPELKSVSKNEFMDLLIRQFNIKNGYSFIDTGDNDKALISQIKLDALIGKMKGKEKYFSLLEQTLQNPFAVLMNEFNDPAKPDLKVLRKTYLAAFIDILKNENIFIYARMLADSTLIWNIL